MPSPSCRTQGVRRGRRRPDRRKARQGGEVRFATILAKETKGDSQNQRVYTLELHEEETLRSLLESWNEESEPASPIRSAEKILRAAEGKVNLSGDACAKEELLGDFTADVLADGKFLAQRVQTDASRFRQLVRVLPQLVQRAVKIAESAPDARRVKDTRAFHVLVVPVRVDGKVWAARLTLRAPDGVAHKFYALSEFEIENGLVASGFAAGEVTSRARPASSKPLTVTVSDLARAVNVEITSGKDVPLFSCGLGRQCVCVAGKCWNAITAISFMTLTQRAWNLCLPKMKRPLLFLSLDGSNPWRVTSSDTLQEAGYCAGCRKSSRRRMRGFRAGYLLPPVMLWMYLILRASSMALTLPLFGRGAM